MAHNSQGIFNGLLAIAIASLMACRTDGPAATAPAPDFSIRGHESGPVFRADVDVSISAATLNELPGSAPAQQVTYHLERSRNARGEWRTSYSNLVLPSDRLGDGGGAEPGVSRFDIDDAGRITALNRMGKPIDMRFARVPDSLRGKEMISPEEVARLQAGLQASGKSSGIGRFVLDREKQSAAIRSLEAAGKKIHQDGSRIVYELKGGALRVTADQALGAIVESERRPAKGPVTRVTYDFAEVSPGRYARTHTHLEREAFENAPGLSVDTRLTNVFLAQEVK